MHLVDHAVSIDDHILFSQLAGKSLKSMFRYLIALVFGEMSCCDVVVDSNPAGCMVFSAIN